MNSFIDKVKRWFKKSSFGIILTSIAIVLVVSVGLIINSNDDVTVAKPTDSFNEISSVEDSETMESSSENIVKEEKLRVPFTIDATISRYFFDSTDSIEIKSQALINYENKFVPSLGVSYTYDNKKFDVVSSFEGIVVEKINDSLYGLTIVIENKEGLRAHYSGLSDVSVYVSQTITQGQKIGVSGESIINSSLGNHLHFALQYGNDYINPLKAFDKTVDEIIN